MAFGFEYWIVYLPAFNRDSFLLFVHNPAGSTKLRDYSRGREHVLGQPRLGEVREATEWGRTRFEERPHTVSGRDGEVYWKSRIAEYNSRYSSLFKNGDGIQKAGSPSVPRTIEMTGLGRAKRGSQRQLQDYVNLTPALLNDAILSTFPAKIQQNSPCINWVSPLAAEQFREFRDAEFLSAIGLGKFSRELIAFWPERGPCWDALGLLTTSLQGALPIALLVEAKSHVAEMYGNGCQAEGKSRELISKSLSAAKRWCGARADADWSGPLYQAANRIAHLYFLKQQLNRPCFLVNLYFVDDPYRPTSESEWRTTLEGVHRELGLAATVPGLIEVFLSGRPVRDDLDGPSAGVEIGAGQPNEPASESGLEIVPALSPIASLQAASLNEELSFAAWCKHWERLGTFQGPILPQPEERIDRVLELWQQDIPGRWKRGIDPQLLDHRYRRGDLHRPHPGEHAIEHQILVERFGSVRLLGDTLIDGINALPLASDFADGGRRGNVEADMLLVAQSEVKFRLALCEVKADANDPWYAAVELLRQMRLFIANPVGRRVMQQRGALPTSAAEAPITGLIVAPAGYYRGRGKKGNTLAPARRLFGAMCRRFSTDVRFTVWEPERNTILEI